MKEMRTVTPSIVALVALAACSGGKPANVHGAPTVPPDDAFESGGGLAYRVLVWNCLGTEHVVMSQRCGEGLTGCGGWTVERAACGAKTPMEVKLATGDRGPIPSGYGWR